MAASADCRVLNFSMIEGVAYKIYVCNLLIYFLLTLVHLIFNLVEDLTKLDKVLDHLLLLIQLVTGHKDSGGPPIEVGGAWAKGETTSTTAPSPLETPWASTAPSSPVSSPAPAAS